MWAAVVLVLLAFNARDVLKDAGVIQPPPAPPATHPEPILPREVQCRKVDYIFETKLVCEGKK